MNRKILAGLIVGALTIAAGLGLGACQTKKIDVKNIEKIEAEYVSGSVENGIGHYPRDGFNLYDPEQIALRITYKKAENETEARTELVAIEPKMLRAEDKAGKGQNGKLGLKGLFDVSDRAAEDRSGECSLTLRCYGFDVPVRIFLGERYEVRFFDVDPETNEPTEQLGKTWRVAEGDRAEQPNVPQKEGYRFIGWMLRRDDGTLVSTTFDNVRGNLDLQAFYQKNSRTVRYCVANDDGTETVIAERSIGPTESGREYFPENPPYREGHEFAGWTENSDVKYTAAYRRARLKIGFRYRKYVEGKRSPETNEYDRSGRYDASARTVTTEIPFDAEYIDAPNDYLPMSEESEGLSDANDYKFLYWYVDANGSKRRAEFPLKCENPHETTFVAQYVDLNEGSPELRYVAEDGETCAVTGFDGEGVAAIPQWKIFEDGTRREVVRASDDAFKGRKITEFVASRENPHFSTFGGALYDKSRKKLIAYPAASEATECATSEELREIGPYAFYDARNLRRIEFGKELTHVKDYAFAGCDRLESAAFPAKLESLGEGAFKTDGDSRLRSVTFEGMRISSIGDEAFFGLKRLEKFEIPASLTSLGEGAFIGCRSLTEIASGARGFVCDEDGTVYGEGHRTLYAYPAKNARASAPEARIDPRCERIARGAFDWAEIVSAVFSGPVALERSSVTCPTLCAIRIETNEFEFDPEAFGEFPPKIAYVPESFESVEALSAAGIEVVRCAPDATPAYAFADDCMSVPRVNPETGAREATLSGIRNAAGDIVLPGLIEGRTVTRIGDNAFRGNAEITSAVIPATVAEIGAGAFRDCANLRWVACRGRAIDVGESAFRDCSSLAAFRFGEPTEGDGADETDGEIGECGEYAFEGAALMNAPDERGFVILGGALLRYAGSALEADVPPETTQIAKDAFKNCGFLRKLRFGDAIADAAHRLRVVDEYAFFNCIGLTEIEFPSSLREVRANAFLGCDYLFYARYRGLQSDYSLEEWNDASETLKATDPDAYAEQAGRVKVSENAYYQSGKRYPAGTVSEFDANSVDSAGKGTVSFAEGAASTDVRANAIVEPPEPKGMKYSEAFYGWFRDEEFSEPAKFPMRVMPGERIKLHARILDSRYPASDGLRYARDEDSTYAVIGYEGADAHVFVPQRHMGLPVARIGDDAFGEGVTDISIPSAPDEMMRAVSQITRVGADAFKRTEWYRNFPGAFVTLDNLLIGYKGAARTAVVPDSITVMASGAFAGCARLESVVLPDRATRIPDRLFEGCANLARVELGSAVREIGARAFAGCAKLAEIDFGAAPELSVVDPSALDGTAWLNSRVDDLVMINKLAYKYLGASDSLTVPSGTERIGAEAFKGCAGLSVVRFPSSLVSISERAFAGSESLSRAVVPGVGSALAFVMPEAFSGCASLSSINLDSALSLASLGDSAFEGCKALCAPILPPSLAYMGKRAFANSGVETVRFGDSSALVRIEDAAFMGCDALKSVEFGASAALTEIGASAFEGCIALESFATAPRKASILEFGERAFCDCSNLKTLDFETDRLTRIGRGAVRNMGCLVSDSDRFVRLGGILVGYVGNEKNIVIPSDVTMIYDSAFMGKARLERVSIEGNALLGIGDRAFYGCSSLVSLDIPASVESIGADFALGTPWFGKLGDGGDWIVLNGMLVRYASRDAKQAVVPDSATRINGGAFRGASVYDILIGPGVREIERGAFDGIASPGWTLTVAESRSDAGIPTPPSLDFDSEIPGCAAVNFFDASYRDACLLERGWNAQSRLARLRARHKIEYVAKRGEAARVPESEDAYALYAPKPIAPERNYAFAGWYAHCDASGYSAPLEYPFFPDGDAVVYARFINRKLGSPASDFICEELPDGSCAISGYNNYADKTVVVIGEYSEKKIRSVTGALGYILKDDDFAEIDYSGRDLYKPLARGGFKKAELGAVGDLYVRNDIVEELDFVTNSQIETLGEHCFAGMESLRVVRLPASLKRISKYAFADCKNLREVIFDGACVDLCIESMAFSGCDSLRSLRFPVGLKTLESDAFKGCPNLSEVYLQTPIGLNGGKIKPFARGVTIYVPWGARPSFVTQWKEYESELVELPPPESSASPPKNRSAA